MTEKIEVGTEDIPINENILNETLIHLKEQYEKFEEHNELLKHQLVELKKSFCSIYGVIRLLDIMIEITNNIDGVDKEIINQVELLRSFSSDIFERQILT